MSMLLALAGAAGPLGLAYLLVILGRLSMRLGTVVKLPPIYRWQYLAAGLVGLAGVIELVRTAALHDPTGMPEWSRSAALVLWGTHVPFAAGAGLGLLAAWPYWGWLIRRGGRA